MNRMVIFSILSLYRDSTIDDRNEVGVSDKVDHIPTKKSVHTTE